MMKMDGRDSAECQNWEKKDINVILEKFKLVKDKTCIVTCLLQMKRSQNLGKEMRDPVANFLKFL